MKYKYMEIIEKIKYFGLRKRTGFTEFGFCENGFRFERDSFYDDTMTVTGDRLSIFLMSPDGDELLVYKEIKFDQNSEHNESVFTPGPWTDHIKEMFISFKKEINKAARLKDKQDNERTKLKQKAEKERIEKFKKLFE